MRERLERNLQDALYEIKKYKINREDIYIIYDKIQTLIKRYETIPEKYWEVHRLDTTWDIDFIIYSLGSIGARYTVCDIEEAIIEANKTLDKLISDFVTIFIDPKTEKVIQQFKEQNKEESAS